MHALFFLFPLCVQAQSPEIVKLSPEPEVVQTGDLGTVVFTNDGLRVLYLADEPRPVRELYSAPADGSAPSIRLNRPLEAGHSIPGYRISSDDRCVVYKICWGPLVRSRYTTYRLSPMMDSGQGPLQFPTGHWPRAL